MYTTRRLIVHESLYNEVNKIIKAYTQLKIGNPLDETNHVGPLKDKDAVNMLEAIERTRKEVPF